MMLWTEGMMSLVQSEKLEGHAPYICLSDVPDELDAKGECDSLTTS